MDLRQQNLDPLGNHGPICVTVWNNMCKFLLSFLQCWLACKIEWSVCVGDIWKNVKLLHIYEMTYPVLHDSYSFRYTRPFQQQGAEGSQSWPRPTKLHTVDQENVPARWAGLGTLSAAGGSFSFVHRCAVFPGIFQRDNFSKIWRSYFSELPVCRGSQMYFDRSALISAAFSFHHVFSFFSCLTITAVYPLNWSFGDKSLALLKFLFGKLR